MKPKSKLGRLVFLAALFIGIFLASKLFSTDNSKKESFKKVFYVVRHAEKRTDTATNNPPLTEEGINRAERLANMLVSEPIEGLFSTPLLRTEGTLSPLSKLNGKPIQNYGYNQYGTLIDSLLKVEKNAIYVIAGHSNTVLETVQAIGCETPMKEIKDSEYQYLFKAKYKAKNCQLEVIEF